MTVATTFMWTDLQIDAASESERIVEAIRRQVGSRLRRRGAVLGISGGIDSSVTAALCVRALGADRVLGLFMPERDSSGDSLQLGRLLADHLASMTDAYALVEHARLLEMGAVPIPSAEQLRSERFHDA